MRKSITIELDDKPNYGEDGADTLITVMPKQDDQGVLYADGMGHAFILRTEPAEVVTLTEKACHVLGEGPDFAKAAALLVESKISVTQMNNARRRGRAAQRLCDRAAENDQRLSQMFAQNFGLGTELEVTAVAARACKEIQKKTIRGN